MERKNLKFSPKSFYFFLFSDGLWASQKIMTIDPLIFRKPSHSLTHTRSHTLTLTHTPHALLSLYFVFYRRDNERLHIKVTGYGSNPIKWPTFVLQVGFLFSIELDYFSLWTEFNKTRSYRHQWPLRDTSSRPLLLPEWKSLRSWCGRSRLRHRSEKVELL